MKTIRFTGETAIAFGTAGMFRPGQESTVGNDIADRLIAKGYFTEVIQNKSKIKTEDKGE